MCVYFSIYCAVGVRLVGVGGGALGVYGWWGLAVVRLVGVGGGVVGVRCSVPVFGLLVASCPVSSPVPALCRPVIRVAWGPRESCLRCVRVDFCSCLGFDI